VGHLINWFRNHFLYFLKTHIWCQTLALGQKFDNANLLCYGGTSSLVAKVVFSIVLHSSELKTEPLQEFLNVPCSAPGPTLQSPIPVGICQKEVHFGYDIRLV